MIFWNIFYTFYITVTSPHESVLGSLLYNIFVNELCYVINHSVFFFFADNFKLYRAITSSDDCVLLHSDIDCVHNWCSEII
jgi:hypothetical protein